MPIMLNPYLNFDTNTAEVLDFYKNVFGGTLEISRFGDFNTMPVAEVHKDLVMHGVLKSDDLQLMAADSAPMGGTKFGTNISLSLSGDDDEKLTGYFNKLSEGGTVTAPLEIAAWGDKFGMFTDKFGINWLVNVLKPKV